MLDKDMFKFVHRKPFWLILGIGLLLIVLALFPILGNMSNSAASQAHTSGSSVRNGSVLSIDGHNVPIHIQQDGKGTVSSGDGSTSGTSMLYARPASGSTFSYNAQQKVLMGSINIQGTTQQFAINTNEIFQVYQAIHLFNSTTAQTPSTAQQSTIANADPWFHNNYLYQKPFTTSEAAPAGTQAAIQIHELQWPSKAMLSSGIFRQEACQVTSNTQTEKDLNTIASLIDKEHDQEDSFVNDALSTLVQAFTQMLSLQTNQITSLDTKMLITMLIMHILLPEMGLLGHLLMIPIGGLFGLVTNVVVAAIIAIVGIAAAYIVIHLVPIIITGIQLVSTYDHLTGTK